MGFEGFPSITNNNINNKYLVMYKHICTIFLFVALATLASAFVVKRDGVTFTSPTSDATFAVGENIPVSLDFRRYGMSYYSFPVTIVMVDQVANTSTTVKTFETEAPLTPFQIPAPAVGDYRFEVHLATRYIHYTPEGMVPEWNNDAVVASVHFSVSDAVIATTTIPEVSIEPTSWATQSPGATTTEEKSTVPTEQPTLSGTSPSSSSSSAHSIRIQRIDKLTMLGSLLGLVGYMVLV